jgi:nicotinate-nucleotide pyrophosphorylase (carboxylating)
VKKDSIVRTKGCLHPKNYLYRNFLTSNKEMQGLTVEQFIDEALKEDVGAGDHTSLACIKEAAAGKAVVKVKEDGIIAGLVLAEQILNRVDNRIKVKTLVSEGAVVKNGDIVITIEGRVRSILTAERLVLNCLQRMSGIASVTRKYVEKLDGLKTKVLDTRKTTPNFRMFEKWAVKIGGGENHRFGLYDMILVKDNHIDACGGITKAIQAANDYLLKNKLSIPIEIETRTMLEVQQVLEAGRVNRILLDNFHPDLLKEAVKLINGRLETEASGGITLDNVRQYAECGVDYVSVGALTHSYKSLDISLKIIS